MSKYGKLIIKAIAFIGESPSELETTKMLFFSASIVNFQELGEQLVMVVDQLKVPLVLGLGEGAGANILAR